MTGFHRASLLDLVARGESLPLLARGILLLCTARPDLTVAAAWDFAIGDRDRAVWQAWQAGQTGQTGQTGQQGNDSNLEAITTCPECAEAVEFSLPPDFVPPPAVSDHASLQVGKKYLTLRLPTSRDLLTAQQGKFTSRDLLIESEETPEITEQAIEAALDAADPGLDIMIAHNCPSCAAKWGQSFDVIRFVWQDCVLRAGRLLHDIDMIARAYHWPESDILTLSDHRRACYIAMIRDQPDGTAQQLHSIRRRQS